MTWFKKWLQGRSENENIIKEAGRPDDGVFLALEATEIERDGGQDFYSKFVVAEKTRFGDPWIVVGPREEVSLGTQKDQDGDGGLQKSKSGVEDFFDAPEDGITDYEVTERTRNGDPWIVVYHKNQVEADDDFFDNMLVSKNNFTQHDDLVFFDKFTILEKTRQGCPWLIVQHKDAKQDFCDDFFDNELFPSKYLVTEKTRFGDPWIVVYLEHESELLDDFFDTKNEQNALLDGSDFYVSERRRSGEIWVVVEHARQQDLKLTCDYCVEDDFFETLDTKKIDECTIEDFQKSDNIEKDYASESALAQSLLDSLEYMKDDVSKTDNVFAKNVLKPSDILQDDTDKKSMDSSEYQYVITERTRDGDPWVIVDPLNRRLPTSDNFFDAPPEPNGLIPDSQLVITQRTRLGEPWLVIDLPSAGSSKTTPSEDNAFFDLLPISKDGATNFPNRFAKKSRKGEKWLRSVEKLKKKTRAPILNLQEYFHLNDSGDLRVINFGVKVQKGWDSCSGPWKWWHRVPLGREAREEKRGLWGKLIGGIKKIWRKYGK